MPWHTKCFTDSGIRFIDASLQGLGKELKKWKGRNGGIYKGTSFTFAPLQVITVLGGLFFLFAMVIGIFAIAK